MGDLLGCLLVYVELSDGLKLPTAATKTQKHLCPLASIATVTFLEDDHQDLRICSRSDHEF